MFRITVIIMIVLLQNVLSYAQWYDPEKVNKKALKVNADALQLAQNQDFEAAIKKLNEAIALDKKFLDAYLSIGGLYGQSKKYAEAVDYYQQAFALDSVYAKPFLLPYSINLAGLGKFSQAMQAVDNFKTTPKLGETSLKSAAFRSKCYQFALDFEKQYGNTFSFQPKNLGDSINTKFLEYFPSITIDGKQLVFTRRVNNNNEDFFVSNIKSNKEWGAAISLPGDVNTAQNEGAQNISQDGSILFFTGCHLPNGSGSCDLYYSLWINGGWSTPVSAGRNINTEFWESQPSLSSDKRTLYFAARDPIGYGGSDVYYSQLDDKGKWGIPLNLGKNINTSGDESCPFIHADNQTLYFTSTGHQGYGGEDLFMTRRDTANKWGKPINLGYPINTIENEGSLIIAADGVTAYYASDRFDSRGGLDLYSFPIRNEMRPAATLWINGSVYDSLTKQPINGIIELIDAKTSKLVQKIQSNDSGTFFITLPTGKDYLFNVNRMGYFFYSDRFNLSKAAPDFEYRKTIPLIPLAKNTAITLDDILYETNKFNLKPESAIVIDKLITLMLANPSLVIEIDGHTDNVGIAKTNLTLSTNRAKEVVKYMTQKGIAANRLVAKGFGSTKPIADNKTENGRSKNRRTVMKVISI